MSSNDPRDVLGGTPRGVWLLLVLTLLTFLEYGGSWCASTGVGLGLVDGLVFSVRLVSVEMVLPVGGPDSDAVGDDEEVYELMLLSGLGGVISSWLEGWYAFACKMNPPSWELRSFSPFTSQTVGGTSFVLELDRLLPC